MDGAYTSIKTKEHALFTLIVLFSAGWSRIYSKHCMGLTKRNSTKRHAVVAETLSKMFMAPRQKSWITLIVLLDQTFLVKIFSMA